jgi:hypothetical protein
MFPSKRKPQIDTLNCGESSKSSKPSLSRQHLQKAMLQSPKFAYYVQNNTTPQSSPAPLSPRHLELLKSPLPHQTKRKGKGKKPLGAPKNPRSAYTLYMKCIRDEVAEQNPGATFAEIGRTVGEKWRTMSPQTRQVPFTFFYSGPHFNKVYL